MEVERSAKETRDVVLAETDSSSSGSSTREECNCSGGGSEASRQNVEASSSASSSSSKQLQNGFKIPVSWVNAPEFVPSWLAKSETCSGKEKSQQKDKGKLDEDLECSGQDQEAASKNELPPGIPINGDTSSELCPYAVIGECRYGYKCILVHGLKCDYCGQYCLHPSDPSQRERHQKSCIAEHESNMNLSFAIASSLEKVCGICYEKILSKNTPGEQRFGILPNCSHCYCLSCIRRWRSERQFDNKTIRACPECRVTSDFVCPSRYWVDNKEDKEKLISSYKVALSKKPCRYYRNGDGQCPFGNKCFYLHAIDGNVIDVGPPRRISGGQGRVRTTAQTLSIWEYIEEWEMQWLDLEDFMGMFDSDTTSEFSLPDMDDDLEGDDIYDMYLDWDRLYR